MNKKNIFKIKLLAILTLLLFLFCGKGEKKVSKEGVTSNTIDSSAQKNDSLRKADSLKVAKNDSLNRVIDQQMQALVAGLVFDSTTNKKTNTAKKSSVKSTKILASNLKKTDNSKKLLQYRSMESIKASILKHSSSVQAIYKKILKLDPNISGVVSVKFIVLPNGKIADVSIAKTEIDNLKFREEFLNYIKDITFKEVPNGLGNMSFVFPFEFSSN